MLIKFPIGIDNTRMKITRLRCSDGAYVIEDEPDLIGDESRVDSIEALEGREFGIWFKITGAAGSILVPAHAVTWIEVRDAGD